jgi:hypothetical protein
MTDRAVPSAQQITDMATQVDATPGKAEAPFGSYSVDANNTIN